jgi:hypothetical protein
MEKYAILIQKYIRGHLVRKHNGITNRQLKQLFNQYQCSCNLIDQINTTLSRKKIRKSNFPSHISENIVKNAMYNKYHIMPNWNCKVGDLTFCNRKIEVKAFTSAGPSSFGPNENWDWIYFLDCIDFENVKIYEIKLSNTSPEWKTIMVNSSETFYDQCRQKRRPRVKFEDIRKQLYSYISTIFTGNIDLLTK